jgi:hypothetical protein
LAAACYQMLAPCDLLIRGIGQAKGVWCSSGLFCPIPGAQASCRLAISISDSLHTSQRPAAHSLARRRGRRSAERPRGLAAAAHNWLGAAFPRSMALLPQCCCCKSTLRIAECFQKWLAADHPPRSTVSPTHTPRSPSRPPDIASSVASRSCLLQPSWPVWVL